MAPTPQESHQIMAEVSSSWDVTFPVLIELLASLATKKLAMPYCVLVVLALVALSAKSAMRMMKGCIAASARAKKEFPSAFVI